MICTICNSVRHRAHRCPKRGESTNLRVNWDTYEANMSMNLARQAFTAALGPNSGVSLLKGIARCVNGGRQMAYTFTVMNTDGTTTDLTQTLDANVDPIATAAAMASSYLAQQQQAGNIPVAAPSVETMTVTPE